MNLNAFVHEDVLRALDCQLLLSRTTIIKECRVGHSMSLQYLSHHDLHSFSLAAALTKLTSETTVLEQMLN